MTVTVYENPVQRLATLIHTSLTADAETVANAMVETVAILKLCRSNIERSDIIQSVKDVLTLENNPFTPQRLMGVLKCFKDSSSGRKCVNNFAEFFFAVLCHEFITGDAPFWWEIEEANKPISPFGGVGMGMGMGIPNSSVYVQSFTLPFQQRSTLFSGVMQGNMSYSLCGMNTIIFTEEKALDGFTLTCGIAYRYNPHITESDTVAYGHLHIPTLEKWIIEEVILLEHGNRFEAVKNALSYYKRKKGGFGEVLEIAERYGVREQLQRLLDIREKCSLRYDDDDEFGCDDNE